MKTQNKRTITSTLSFDEIKQMVAERMTYTSPGYITRKQRVDLDLLPDGVRVTVTQEYVEGDE